MRFGTRETFAYVECAGCGCLQIAADPLELGRHRPDAPLPGAPREGPSGLVGAARRARSHVLYGTVGRKGGMPWVVPRYHPWIQGAGAGLDSAIADVGRGTGQLLRELRADGFRDLTGIDPDLAQEVDEPGFRLRRGELADLEGPFDLVMLHHSLARMADQLHALRELARVIGPAGVALVRIPVADSWAWRQFGTDWVHVDAPRNLYLHTRRSLEHAARAAGLRITSVRHDSGAEQFWGSELYRRDLPLVDPATSRPLEPAAHFNRLDLLRYRIRARRLNASGEGDQACFFLRRA
jgi:SAM-dependent methyltransferase